jgi:hypothetical protein
MAIVRRGGGLFLLPAFGQLLRCGQTGLIVLAAQQVPQRGSRFVVDVPRHLLLGEVKQAVPLGGILPGPADEQIRLAVKLGRDGFPGGSRRAQFGGRFHVLMRSRRWAFHVNLQRGCGRRDSRPK